jgi:hypothetical protein
MTLLDTGAFNTMIDIEFAETFGIMLPMTIPITIGGNLGKAQGCVIPKIIIGNFEATRVFTMAYPFKDWLARYIIIGTNVLNNWDFAISRSENTLNFVERIPQYVTNKKHPYQNYFLRGEYVAVQDDTVEHAGGSDNGKQTDH